GRVQDPQLPGGRCARQLRVPDQPVRLWPGAVGSHTRGCGHLVHPSGLQHGQRRVDVLRPVPQGSRRPGAGQAGRGLAAGPRLRCRRTRAVAGLLQLPTTLGKGEQRMPLELPSGTGVQMQSPGSIAKHMTRLLNGKAKAGKTTLAASAAAVEEMSAVAVVDFEGSTEAVAGLYDVDVYRCTNWTESSAVLDAMINQHSEHGYKTVVLDPLNAL